jgi:hypothetical protein
MDDDLEFLFADETPLEPDDSEAHIGNEPDSFMLSENEEEAPDPIQLKQSRDRRARLQEEDMVEKVKIVLNTIYSQGLDLPIFLDAVCWGNDACISDGSIKSARTR